MRECLTLLGLSVYSETHKQQLLNFLATLTRLNFDAGTDISYSNTGYRLVEAALERKGFAFDDFIQNEIAGPLDIAFKAPDIWAEPVQGLAPGYLKTGNKWQLSAAGLHLSASGSLTGSGTSLARWLQHLLTGSGKFSGLLAAFSAIRHLHDGRPSGYGLGLYWSRLADRYFVGHGGSHPGYKSHFLLDPEAGTGFVVVSNREDVNTSQIALAAMSALTALPLPQTNCMLRDGFYVTEDGPHWIELKHGVVSYLDAEETLYDDGNGWYLSRSASSPMRLRQTGAAIEGEAGYVQRRFLPVIPEPASAELDGHWTAGEYGAHFDIRHGVVIMGAGPARQFMPLLGLGNGRYLFTLDDGPWKKRICLNRLSEEKVELVLSRSRVIEYTLMH